MTVDTAAQTGLRLKDIEGPLPELKLTYRRFDRPVMEANDKYSSRDMVVREVGNYTVILSPGDQLCVVDEQGHPVPGFDAVGSLTVMDWSLLRGSGLQYTQIALDSANLFSTYNVRKVSQCASAMRPFIQAYISKQRTNGVTDIPQESWKVGDPDLTHQAVLRNNYILFHDAESQCFVAYEIVDAQDQPLEPRNWKRFDNKNEYVGNVPSEILEQVKALREAHNHRIRYIKSVSNYRVIASDNKVSVVKTGNPYTQEEFTDHLSEVGDNLCVDPKNPKIIYYCSGTNPHEVLRLNTEGDPQTWKTESIPIPGSYRHISSLLPDPTGTALMFEIGDEVVLVEKNSFRELNRLPLKKAIFDKQGRIRGLDRTGHLIIIDANLQEIAVEVEKRRVARMALGVSATGILTASQPATSESTEPVEDNEVLLPTRQRLEAEFLSNLVCAQSFEEISTIEEALQVLRSQLMERGFSGDQVNYLTQSMAETMNQRRQQFAQIEADEIILNLEPRLSPSYISEATIEVLRTEGDRLKVLLGFVDQERRIKITVLTQKLDAQIGELYHRKGEEIKTNLNHQLSSLTAQLESMQSRAELSDWIDQDFPFFKEKLALLAHNCPIDAYDIQKQIIETLREAEKVVSSYEVKFKRRYSEVREKAMEITAERVTLLSSRINSFIDRTRDREFKTRDDVSLFIDASKSRAELEEEITALERQDPERAAELAMSLKVKIANLLGEVDIASRIQTDGTGRHKHPFGRILFPIWEHKAHPATSKMQIDLAFIPNEGSIRSGAPLDQIQGDIGFRMIDSTGKVRVVRLFEGDMAESDWRFGMRTKFGAEIPPAYVTRAEFMKFKKDYEVWNRINSPLQAEYRQRRQVLLAHLRTRPRLGTETARADIDSGMVNKQNNADYQDNAAWRAQFDGLNQEYSKFISDHHIMLLDRFDKVRDSSSREYVNGKGYVPSWENHWVLDDFTEENLEKMAAHLQLQLELREGLLMLKGHAGTGKDVLVKMFCHFVNRNYFGFDCSKWTTDEDLTEVVMLDASEGATRTIKIPSAVYNAIQTPGGVLYFNEFNAMPEETQIFLHSLFDEKRSITLKTESGKVIKADPSVLIMASMNPGYKGTTPIQIATRSRFVDLEIGYPPMQGKRQDNDPNLNPPYAATEALRVARSVASLKDLTLDRDMSRNGFARAWDRYINFIDNGAPALTPVQQYDLEVILALVQFSEKLRKEFILSYEKTPGIKATLPVELPITGREMRRAAFALSQVPEQEKILGAVDPESRARSLLDTFFLMHIDESTKRDKIRAAWITWTSEKRIH